MKIVHSPKQAQDLIFKFKRLNKMVGFVPTMGALHHGHVSLIRKARKENDIVVVSIFVNPAQFGPNEDLKKYPRPFGQDAAICKKEGVDLIFAPKPSDMYPQNYMTYVAVEKLSDLMCGACRPGHFRGVATIVAKLFNIVQPDNAYFGLKDYQQSVVIKKMVVDLNFPVVIKTLPTIRENDGLALSSRNVFLTPAQRQKALAIPSALKEAKQLIRSKKVKTAKAVISHMKTILRANVSKIDYIDIRDAETLKEVKQIRKKVVVAVAAFVGNTRLIDNVVV